MAYSNEISSFFKYNKLFSQPVSKPANCALLVKQTASLFTPNVYIIYVLNWFENRNNISLFFMVEIYRKT